MYHRAWDLRRNSRTGQSDVGPLIASYGYLTAAVLARREWQEDMLAEQVARRDAQLPRASWLERIRNWLGNWVLRRGDSPIRTATAPAPRPGLSLEEVRASYATCVGPACDIYRSNTYSSRCRGRFSARQ